MAAQYLIVRIVVCHSTGLVYVRQHLDRIVDDLFSSMKYRGVRREPSLCLSQYGSAELSEYQKTVPETQYCPTCLDRLRVTLRLCLIAVYCKASPDALYTPCKSAAQTKQEVCRLML